METVEPEIIKNSVKTGVFVQSRWIKSPLLYQLSYSLAEVPSYPKKKPRQGQRSLTPDRCQRHAAVFARPARTSPDELAQLILHAALGWLPLACLRCSRVK